MSENRKCPYEKNCGGCQYVSTPYAEQLKKKQKEVAKLLSPFCKVEPIIGMENPEHYRNKVHAALAQLDRVFGYEPKGRGFESPTARQKRSNFCLPKVTSFFIQAAGLAYHHALACISSAPLGLYLITRQRVYHQLLWSCISSRQSRV